MRDSPPETAPWPTRSARPASWTTSSAWPAPEPRRSSTSRTRSPTFTGPCPTSRFTIEDSVEQGDAIWVRVRGRGTATGPFFGPPSNRPVNFTVIDIARVVDGRLVEHWGVPDRFAMLVQTGVLDRLAPAS